MDAVIFTAMKKLKEFENATMRLKVFIATYEELSGNKVSQNNKVALPDQRANRTVVTKR